MSFSFGESPSTKNLTNQRYMCKLHRKTLNQKMMKMLMIDASQKVDAWLRVRDLALQHAPEVWWV